MGCRSLRFVIPLLAAACVGRGESGPTTNAAPSTRRVLAPGAVVGFEGPNESHTWLGIPFARPPVGELRWRAPEPPEPWPGTREALAFGSPCTQIASPVGGVTAAAPGQPTGSEDCLYLNVYTPRFPEGRVPTGAARLPVMVWIHGGGHTIGHTGFYDGSNLAASQSLVVVTVSYRLGAFGWFRHPALAGADASAGDRSGNYGTLDLIQALRFVRENAAAFGGDPGNVTIFGESAGGSNVVTLLVSPLAKGLFHRAIVQSGGTWTDAVAAGENFTDDPTPGHPKSSREILLVLLQKDGLAAERAAAKARLAAMSDPEITSYLRGKSHLEILAATATDTELGMYDCPKLFRDGAVLPEEKPGALFASGRYHQVPVMLGTNRDENKIFMFLDPRWVKRLFGILLWVSDEEQYHMTADYRARMWKAAGADELAAAMREVQGPSVFVYRFDWDEEPNLLWSDFGEILGAAHGFEIPFVFGHFDLGEEGSVLFSEENAPGREALSKSMMSYWAQFAAGGDPDRGRDGKEPRWAPWDNSSAASGKFLVLDTPAGGGLRMSSDTMSTERILADIDGDPRLPTQQAKCEMFAALLGWSDRFTEEDYPTAGSAGCADYALVDQR